MAVFGERPRALRLHGCREARHAAAPVLVFVDSVDIVDQKKRHAGGGISGGKGARGRGGYARASGQHGHQGLAAGELCHLCLVRVRLGPLDSESDASICDDHWAKSSTVKEYIY
ncbi:MAG: hypothetical protein ACREBP_06315, partial [Sphingomicrobium sp.]